jgi:hypothetical protein
VFLYHAYALALGGWVKTAGHLTPIESIAPSVLSITGGFGSTSADHVNSGVRGRFPFGETGPSDFSVYVGHAYTEVSGTESDEDYPYGEYRTSVRSVLDNVRINDVLVIEHAEAILRSTHRKPGTDTPAPEAEILVGESNISGLSVAGVPVTLTPHERIDRMPTFDVLQGQVMPHIAAARTGGGTADPFLDELCDWHNPSLLTDEPPDYAVDLATMNHDATSHFRYSLYKSVDVARRTPGVRPYKSSVEVSEFGRIFFGEVFASHGTKQVAMFRIDLGCDNCGGVGGSGGSTNGSSYPP